MVTTAAPPVLQIDLAWFHVSHSYHSQSCVKKPVPILSMWNDCLRNHMFKPLTFVRNMMKELTHNSLFIYLGSCGLYWQSADKKPEQKKKGRCASNGRRLGVEPATAAGGLQRLLQNRETISHILYVDDMMQVTDAKTGNLLTDISKSWSFFKDLCLTTSFRNSNFSFAVFIRTQLNISDIWLEKLIFS